MKQAKLLRSHDPLLSAALKTADKTHVYVVVRSNKVSQFTLRWRGGAIEDVVIDSSEGIGLYCFTKQGYVAFGSTDILTTDSITKLVHDTAEIAKMNEKAKADKAPEIFELAFQENLGEDALHYNVVSVEEIDQTPITAFIAEVERHIQEVEPSAQTSFRCNVEQVQWRIARSDGTDVDFAIPYARFTAIINIRKGDKSTMGYTSVYKPLLGELLDSIQEVKDRTKLEIELALEQLEAESVTAGSAPVLVAGDLAGTLVHEALGHPAESDAVAENASVLGDSKNSFMQGTQVAAKGVTIKDHEEGLNHGFHPYGAFGNKREAVTIIEDGMLKESISDVFTAKKTGVANKNAERSEHYNAVAIPRMSTTFIELSKDKMLAEDLPSAEPKAVRELLLEHNIFAQHPKIYYLLGFRGGQVSPKSGDFMFGSAYTYELTKDGITAKRPASFSGNVLEALKSIEFGVGKLQTNDFGFCGKSGQRAYVSDGGHELIFFAPTKHVSIA